MTWPNKSPEPTAVGAYLFTRRFPSCHVAVPPWLSFFVRPLGFAMTKHLNVCSWITKRVCFLAAFFLASRSIQGCTIFVLTDTNRVLFCNNEDWKATKPKIWFVAGDKHYGCAYVGFVTQLPEGGCNTKGLAFDWVAGWNEKWQRSPKQKIARASRMNECLKPAPMSRRPSLFIRHIGSRVLALPRCSWLTAPAR